MHCQGPASVGPIMGDVNLDHLVKMMSTVVFNYYRVTLFPFISKI